MRAEICYLSAYQYLSAKPLAEAMDALFGLPASTGTVLSVPARAHDGLAGFETQVKEHWPPPRWRTRTSPGCGWRPALAARDVHPPSHLLRRPRPARPGGDEPGGPARLWGTLATDALASYTIYGETQALCGAHVLRELIAVTHRDPAWAQAMIDVLTEAKEAVADAAAAGHHALAPDTLTCFQDRYQQAALFGIAGNPYSGHRAETQGHSTGRTAVVLHRGVLAAHDRLRRVPFDNHQTERNLRMVKAQQKISECWRTMTGARRFAWTRSYISTVRKHGINPPHRPTRPLHRTAMDAAHS
ncbi:transposase [Streptomyces solisilvae]|uniref:IS66 family transposase n=1 Tax=Streptomyces malaysiensis TaxID=92644 RepID=UPI0036BCD697